MKVLFITPYPLDVAPSQRFRFEQYFMILRENNIHFDVSPFIDQNTWKVLYLKGFILAKIYGIIKGFIRRLFMLTRLRHYNYIFIHREAAPVGPPVIEWFITKVALKKVVYDFDDAIWVPNSSESNKFFSFLKMYSSVGKICRWAWKVSCGNRYLCNFARQHNKNVIYNPTTVDMEHYHNAEKKYLHEKKPVLGWTGSHSTIRYLNELIPVLEELEQQYSFEFHVISDRQPSFFLKSLVYKPWLKETEIKDLLEFDIGLMPLSDDTWANGKCGFKALQYMALGIPAIVSPIGVNTRIVDHNINGFVCTDQDEWKKYIALLLDDRKLLVKMSEKTREKIANKYSVKSNTNNFLNLFNLQ